MSKNQHIHTAHSLVKTVKHAAASLFVCGALFTFAGSAFAHPNLANPSPEASLEVGTPDTAGVDAALSTFHKAASQADWGTYFGLLSDDAIFLGTDVTEHWTKAQFKAFAERTKGWTYSLRERHIYFAASGDTAWFDEVLDNKAYGTSRGTGVLIRTNTGWKIAQYHLVFPIPNDLAGEITQSIQEFESKAAQP